MSQAAAILDDSDLSDMLLPPIANLLAGIEQVVREQSRAMELVGGNILIHIREVATWTVVTRGPRKGLYYESTDDDIDFALVCEEWVMLDLLEGQVRCDLEKLVELGFLYMQGDYRIYERFMALAEQKNMIALRATAKTGSAAENRSAARSARRVAV